MFMLFKIKSRICTYFENFDHPTDLKKVHTSKFIFYHMQQTF